MNNIMNLIKTFDGLCTPAQIYLGISLITFLGILSQMNAGIKILQPFLIFKSFNIMINDVFPFVVNFKFDLNQIFRLKNKIRNFNKLLN